MIALQVKQKDAAKKIRGGSFARPEGRDTIGPPEEKNSEGKGIPGMHKALQSTGSQWWEITPAKPTEEERNAIRQEGDPEARSKALRSLQERSIRPATPEDGREAERILRNHHRGEYNSASVILDTGHGHAQTKEGVWTRF